jgi:predicted P-loop ATPase
MWGGRVTIDLSDHIGEIARRILGAPNAALSTGTQLRFGRNGSIAVELAGAARGKWFDHENNVGGNPWDLLREKKGLVDGAAYDWLRSELGIGEEPKAAGRIIATYDYPDESGELLFQVVRFDPRDFRQRRPDGKGGWEWSTTGVRKVLYRLPELIAAPSDTAVYVAEGEKDVENIVKLDLVATCNPGGAAAKGTGKRPSKPKWRSEFNQFFVGRDVVILPDNDDVGRDHARAVATNLCPLARQVRIVELPGLSPHGDVSDWLAAGGTRAELKRLATAAPLFESQVREEAAGTPLWQGKLILSQNGNTKPLLANAIIAFREVPEWAGTLWFDAFHQRTVIRGTPPWRTSEEPDQEWTGTHDILAADWLQHAGICVSPDVAGQAVEAVARDRRFHPVLDYLSRCRWDGEPRLDTWTIGYLGTEDNPYARAVAARWMIAAVARVTAPGCKADCALILEGSQGSLKSTALKTLGSPFTDDISDLGTKDAAMQLAGIWILELAELDSMSRGDISRIKAFMSRTTDRFRPPYGRRVVEQPRQCVVAGTVNHNEYLRDETGGRRFWPLACEKKIDINGLDRARDQLWAEARDRYLADEPWWLDTTELDAAAAVEQADRYLTDVWDEPIRRYVKAKATVTIGEVLEDAIGRHIEEWTQPDANRVARCLRALGWQRKQIRFGPGPKDREWRYQRSEDVTTVTSPKDEVVTGKCP